jgi:DNA polymerase III alpha subunit (gram-positive type)
MTIFPGIIHYVCEDCNKFVHSNTVYGYDLKNVCGRCYAIRANHPSARKLVK